MKEKLNLESLYNKMMQSIDYVEENDSGLEKALGSLNIEFREIVYNFISMAMLGVTHEIVRMIQELQEFQSSYTILIDFIGPTEIFSHYKEENSKILTNIITKHLHSDQLFKISTRWEKDYKKKNKKKVEDYLDRTNEMRAKLQKETKLLENDIRFKMKKNYKKNNEEKVEDYKNRINGMRAKLQEESKVLENDIRLKMEKKHKNLLLSDLNTKWKMESMRSSLEDKVKEEAQGYARVYQKKFIKLQVEMKKEMEELKKKNEEIKRDKEQVRKEKEEIRNQLENKEKQQKKIIEEKEKEILEMKKKIYNWTDTNMQSVKNAGNHTLFI